MTKVKKDDYGQGRPAVNAELLGLDVGDFTVLTISKIDPAAMIPQPGAEPRKTMVLTVEEFPDHSYYCNKTSVGRLIEGLGDETSKWPGERVPVYGTEQMNPQTGEPGVVVWVADPKTWEKHLKGFKRAKARKR